MSIKIVSAIFIERMNIVAKSVESNQVGFGKCDQQKNNFDKIHFFAFDYLAE